MIKGKRSRKSAAKASRASATLPQSPMEMTQAEVESLINGGPAAKAVAKRLRAQPTPKIASKLRSKQNLTKSSPAPISKKEMAELKKSGTVPSKARSRIEKYSSQISPAARADKALKAEPTEYPPSKRS